MITAQLDEQAWVQNNRILYRYLGTNEARALPWHEQEQVRQLALRNMQTAFSANPALCDLFIRQHEIECILWQRAYELSEILAGVSRHLEATR